MSEPKRSRRSTSPGRDAAATWADQIRDALAHLHDYPSLQGHPFVRYLPSDQRSRASTAGRALQTALGQAIDALRPTVEGARESRVGRAHQLLRLRYGDGMDVAMVCTRLGISRSEYYREQERAISGLAAILRARWGLDDDPAHDEERKTGASLPRSLTSFIGRLQEMALARQLLQRGALLTLSGPPGSGKTRLALEVARHVADDFLEGAAFVSLAAVRDPELVPSAIGQALGLGDTGARPMIEVLKDYLAHRHVLLVLDNFEQVWEAAPGVGALLQACPGLTILVTSRGPLRIHGERELTVPPLRLLEPDSTPTAERLRETEAPLLFCERAREVKPDFVPSEQNAPIIAEICRRLDGLPLAIELAAGRMRTLPPKAILARLERRLGLLKSDAQDLPPRQQTLRAAIAWSYELLDDVEQALLRRLAVFVGSFTLAAAEAVCGVPDMGGDAVLDGLDSLVEKSLVQVVGSSEAAEPRFMLLETIREFALEQLEGRAEWVAVRRGHAAYFLGLAEEAAPRLLGPEQKATLARLDLEHDNLRAAIGVLIGAGDATSSLRLVQALCYFWFYRGFYREGRQWSDQALAIDSGRSALRGWALLGVAVYATDQGDSAVARRYLEEGLEIAREVGDTALLARTLDRLGHVARETGDYTRAMVLAEECLVLRRESGDQYGVFLGLHLSGTTAFLQGDFDRSATLLEEASRLSRASGHRIDLPYVLEYLGRAARLRGELDRARSIFAEALDIAREMSSQRGIGVSLVGLGAVARAEGDPVAALAQFRDGLTVLRDIGERSRIALAIEQLAGLLGAQGAAERAARLFGAMEALRETIGAPLPPERAEYARDLAQLRTALGEEAFASAWAAGRVMPWEHAVLSALEEGAGG